MAERSQEEIQRLLREGLDHYGVDEVSEAMVAWNKVLELDPGNVEALDYIRTADRRRHPRPPKKGGAAVARATAMQEARVLLDRGDVAPAFDLLAGAPSPDAGGIEYQAVFDLARCRLYETYCERVGDLGRVPRVCGEAGALTRYNLPSDAGFVLSMVDGETSLADLISLSGMDAFDALHTVNGLLDAGLVEMTE
jgi:hypothetical protein